jgi:hypothetical protein
MMFGANAFKSTSSRRTYPDAISADDDRRLIIVILGLKEDRNAP